jgi:hypothetical protein
MADEQKIVVEVPSDRGHYSPVPIPQSNKLEEFKKGWVNAIALPDNFTDLAFDLTASLTIPALFSSCWANLPLPCFLQLAVIGALIVNGAIACYLYKAVPEIQSILLIRVGLVALGVALGL